MLAWFAAVGEGGEAVAGDVPIYWALYQWYRACSGGAKPRAEVWDLPYSFQSTLRSGYRRQFREPTAECRASFWLAFHITPGEQVVIEESIRRRPEDVAWPPVDDWARPQDAAYLLSTLRYPGF